MDQLYRTGKQYAAQAKDSKYDKLTYDQVDCQAFCELVLKDLGVRDSSGRPYNWKGSNDMARNAVSWIGTKEEAIRAFGSIPLGSWAFIWDNSGKEKERGYYDGKGNYAHIGIYVGDNIVRDSTRYKNSDGTYARNGVGNRKLSAFNRIGLPKMLDFEGVPEYNTREKCLALISEIRGRLDELEGLMNEL